MKLIVGGLSVIPPNDAFLEQNATQCVLVPVSTSVKSTRLGTDKQENNFDGFRLVPQLPKMATSSPTFPAVKKTTPSTTHAKERNSSTGPLPSVVSGKPAPKSQHRPLGTARGMKTRLVHTPSQLEGLTDEEKFEVLKGSEDEKIASEFVQLRNMLVQNQARTFYANDDDSIALDAVSSANTLVTISLPNINRPHATRNRSRHTATKMKLKDLERAMDSFATIRKPNLEEFYDINAKWFGRPSRKSFGLSEGSGTKKRGTYCMRSRPVSVADNLARYISDEGKKSPVANKPVDNASEKLQTNTNNKVSTPRKSRTANEDISTSRKPRDESACNHSDDSRASKSTTGAICAKVSMSDLLELQISNSPCHTSNTSTMQSSNGKKRSVRFSINNEVREYDSEAPVSSPTETTFK